MFRQPCTIFISRKFVILDAVYSVHEQGSSGVSSGSMVVTMDKLVVEGDIAVTETLSGELENDPSARGTGQRRLRR